MEKELTFTDGDGEVYTAKLDSGMVTIVSDLQPTFSFYAADVPQIITLILKAVA